MSDEHTPVRLIAGEAWNGEYRLVIKQKGYWGNGLFLSNGTFQPEDARRLAACWNACEGLETATIEAHQHIGFDALSKQWQAHAYKLEEERDAALNKLAAAPDLLEALKMFVWPYQEQCRLTEAERMQKARAAIAKATGETHDQT